MKIFSSDVTIEDPHTSQQVNCQMFVIALIRMFVCELELNASCEQAEHGTMCAGNSTIIIEQQSSHLGERCETFVFVIAIPHPPMIIKLILFCIKCREHLLKGKSRIILGR